MRRRKLYILITFVITLCLLAACGRTEATDPPPEPAAVASAIASAETHFKQRENVENLHRAAAAMSKVRNPEMRDFEVEWRLAKYSYFLGKRLEDEAESTAAFERGRDAGKIASRLEPDRPDGHFWFAANLGELSRRSPITVGLKSVDVIRESMRRVIEIDPLYQSASAYDALGQIELATRFSGGHAAKAVEYLEAGRAISEDNPNIRLHLAEAYIAVRRLAEAKRELDLLLQMKPDPEYLPEYRECVVRAEKLLASKF